MVSCSGGNGCNTAEIIAVEDRESVIEEKPSFSQKAKNPPAAEIPQRILDVPLLFRACFPLHPDYTRGAGGGIEEETRP